MKKVVVFVTAPDAARVRTAIAHSGAGRLGNYSTSVNRALSTVHSPLHAVDEERIEFACDDETFVHVVRAIEAVSRYAAVDAWNMDLLRR